MHLLLDTRALLWWRADTAELSARARSAIAAPENRVFVSVASLWEISIKRRLGKLRFPDDLETIMREEDFELLPIAFAHLRTLDGLPALHRDPFDRLLIAQALAEGLPLVSHDVIFAHYGVGLFW